MKCSKCGSRGIWSKDTGKCIASWNKRLGDTLESKRALVVLAPRMYQLLKEYVGIIEEYVSIYDNFPPDLQDIATQAQELLDRVVEECEG